MAVGTSDLRPSESQGLESKYTRLHITPLNPTLLPSILPPAVLAAARNISYHSLQTFPEKDFGFLDLPSMEAQKIKKKLNGSILKGTKVKIEEARPSKLKAKVEDDAFATPETNSIRRGDSSKKRKRDGETLPGIELRDRKVKRGWTEPVPAKKLDKKSKGKKDVVKSKYTSNPELLFRTALPANKAPSADETAGLKTERKKKRNQAKEVVIHEFSKTTKYASFLRSNKVPSAAKGVAEFVEGKGWVDASGNIIEALIKKEKEPAKHVVQKTTSSSESFENSEVHEESNAEDNPEETLKGPAKPAKLAKAEVSSTSSSESSSDEEDSDDVNDEEGNDISSSSGSEDETSQNDEETHDAQILPSPKTPISLKLDIPKSESPIKPESRVHPLEALFKRRRPNLEASMIPAVAPSFSFFDADGDEDEEKDDVVNSIPMTPYTKQEFAFRGLRSAAPTPDTAFPVKSYDTWPTDNMANGGSIKVNGDTTPTQKHKAKESIPPKDSAETPVSDFQKWFYEHRGENNRAWKRRRKLAAKEKRHRENKKRNERYV